MEIAQRRLQQIDSLYQTMSIYRTVIAYNNVEEFMMLKDILKAHDFTFLMDSPCSRIYELYVGAGVAEGAIDWTTVSLVVCLDTDSLDYIKSNLPVLHNLILVIKI